MTKLPMPITCKCGFSTMDADKALEHLNWHNEQAFIKVRDIAQNYLNTHYPEAPDPCLYAIEVEKTLKEAELL